MQPYFSSAALVPLCALLSKALFQGAVGNGWSPTRGGRNAQVVSPDKVAAGYFATRRPTRPSAIYSILRIDEPYPVRPHSPIQYLCYLW
jgi:hypothetical protein